MQSNLPPKPEVIPVNKQAVIELVSFAVIMTETAILAYKFAQDQETIDKLKNHIKELLVTKEMLEKVEPIEVEKKQNQNKRFNIKFQ